MLRRKEKNVIIKKKKNAPSLWDQAKFTIEQYKHIMNSTML